MTHSYAFVLRCFVFCFSNQHRKAFRKLSPKFRVLYFWNAFINFPLSFNSMILYMSYCMWSSKTEKSLLNTKFHNITYSNVFTERQKKKNHYFISFFHLYFFWALSISSSIKELRYSWERRRPCSRSAYDVVSAVHSPIVNKYHNIPCK